MDTMQIKWDFVVIGNYKLKDYSIMAHLQSFPMNIKKINNLQKIIVTSSHINTTNRIITPVFPKNICHYSRTKLRPIPLIFYLLNRHQWSFDLQSSQCQDTVQQEGATTNRMQIKLNADSYDKNTLISRVY